MISVERVTWHSMRHRCGRKPGYKNIKICKRWDSFENFLKDMGPRPEGYSIERINNKKGYSPKNCIWADKKNPSQK